MIIKTREIPRTILQLEALLKRLPQNHSKVPQIIEELNIRNAGFKGELAIEYPLSLLEEKDYYIFHNLRLKTNKHYFQLDTLILTSKVAIILEVKNYSGTIFFDPEFKQLIQIKDGVEKGYPYPLTQLERYELQLKEWLLQNKLNPINITSLVVISNPYSIIRTSAQEKFLHQKIIHKEDLPTKIPLLVKSQNKHTLDEKELKKISRKLIKQHTERDSSILERFKLNESELLKGAICKHCGSLPLVRIKANWHCPACQNKDKQAHISALNDYKLLIKPKITNCELRDFLSIDSVASASRLLKSMNLPYSGEKKGRVYYLKEWGEVCRKMSNSE